MRGYGSWGDDSCGRWEDRKDVTTGDKIPVSEEFSSKLEMENHVLQGKNPNKMSELDVCLLFKVSSWFYLGLSVGVAGVTWMRAVMS